MRAVRAMVSLGDWGATGAGVHDGRGAKMTGKFL